VACPPRSANGDLRQCFNLGLANCLERSRLTMSLIRSHPTFRCLATS
jgi:hypothetical protein